MASSQPPHGFRKLSYQLCAFSRSAEAAPIVKSKAIVLVLLTLMVPVAIRSKLFRFMMEESLTVLLLVAAGLMALLAVFVVFALLRGCAQSGYRWLSARLRQTHGIGERQQTRQKPVR